METLLLFISLIYLIIETELLFIPLNLFNYRNRAAIYSHIMYLKRNSFSFLFLKKDFMTSFSHILQ